MNKPRATTAGVDKHTSTEAHMSKVEVKKGDTWGNVNVCLLQKRGDKQRRVATNTEMDFSMWETTDSDIVTLPIPTAAARAWIESLGGTVVEEAEEEKAVKVVAHMDLTPTEDYGDIHLSIDGSETCKYRDGEPHIYRRIHIAGVTA